MDEMFRRAAGPRAPYNEASATAGRFGLLPSLLEEFFQPGASEHRGASFPVDIEETESAYQLTADLPGLDKGDIGIDLHENTLTISAERREELGTGRAAPLARTRGREAGADGAIAAASRLGRRQGHLRQRSAAADDAETGSDEDSQDKRRVKLKRAGGSVCPFTPSCHN